jgi:mannose-6-phosphate isomerase-like protein (cupin superfamily)
MKQVLAAPFRTGKMRLDDAGGVVQQHSGQRSEPGRCEAELRWAPARHFRALDLWRSTLRFRARAGMLGRARACGPEDTLMPEPADPYKTFLNVYYEPLDVVDVRKLADDCTHAWYNQTLTRVNDAVVRLGVFNGAYHWHKHDREDEFFYVIDGRLFVDLEERSVELLPRQGITVPRGVVHRTRAPERSVVLMVEAAGVTPTGD